MVSEKVLKLREKRANLIKQARDLIESAERENRSWAQEDENQYSKILDQAEEIRKQYEREERQIELEQELDNSLDEPNKPGTDDEPSHRDNPRASKEYRDAFERFVKHGRSALSEREFRALEATDDTLGGYTVAPEQFVNQLIKEVDDMVFIRQFATVTPITRSESLGVPTLDTDVSDADWTSELGTGNEDNSMKFGKRSLTPHPLAKRVKVSNKLLRASAMNPATLVRQRLAYKFGISQEKAFLTGDGVDKPLGIFTASNDGISTSRDVATDNSATAITFDGLKNAKYTLKGQYWRQARWIFHRDAIKEISKLKDDNNRYLWEDSVRQGDPDRILGLPVMMSEYVPNTFTANQYVGALGDLSNYWIADALDMAIQRLNELYAETNQTGFIGRLETDGMPVLEEAFVRVKLGS